MRAALALAAAVLLAGAAALTGSDTAPSPPAQVGSATTTSPEHSTQPAFTAPADAGSTPAAPSPPPPSTAATGPPPEVPGEAQPAEVVHIVDGDTIDVRVEVPDRIPLGVHRIRLLEIDTPEVGGRAGRECGGTEASDFAARRLPPGSTVYLVADREDTDRYDRFLRYVWTADGEFFNAEAVRLGVASAVLYEPNDRYIAELRALEAEARAAGRGLWGPPCDLDAGSGTAPAAVPSPAPPGGAGCDVSYPTVCIPPAPPDLDCAALPARRFAVNGPDPHRLDGDHDGLGCEGA